MHGVRIVKMIFFVGQLVQGLPTASTADGEVEMAAGLGRRVALQRKSS